MWKKIVWVINTIHHAPTHAPPMHHTMHHPCTDTCTAQLARQSKSKSDPTKPRGIQTTWYCCFLKLLPLCAWRYLWIAHAVLNKCYTTVHDHNFNFIVITFCWTHHYLKLVKCKWTNKIACIAGWMAINLVRGLLEISKIKVFHKKLFLKKSNLNSVKINMIAS